MKKKPKNKIIDTSVCSSCGIEWADHLGIAGTCEKFRNLYLEIESIKDYIEYDGHSDVDTLDGVYDRICKLVEKFK